MAICDDIGPLGGIYSTIQKSTNDVCLVTACDIIDLDPDLLVTMIDRAQKARLVYLKLANSTLQPLPIVLNKNVIPFIEKQIEKGDFKLQNLINAIELSEKSNIVSLQIKNEPKNMNTFDDLKL